MYAIFTNDPKVIEFARSREAQVILVTNTDNENDIDANIEADYELLISEFLTKYLHIPVHIQGFTYLKEIISKSFTHDGFERKSMISTIYKHCADTFCTPITSVERCIRHAIHLSYDRRNYEMYQKIFNTQDRLANSEFIRTAIHYFKEHYTML